MELENFNSPDVRGVWIYGKPGSGKSYYVRYDLLGRGREAGTELTLYSKAQNKWWDGYRGQSLVLLDDLDTQGACLSHYLKIWLDRYAVTGEIKGGTTPLTYEKFYITSNYLPSELWPHDRPLIEAIERRCELIEITYDGIFRSIKRPHSRPGWGGKPLQDTGM